MNPDDYESLPTTSVAINMTAGAIAGVLEHIVMYPMDSVKVSLVSFGNNNAVPWLITGTIIFFVLLNQNDSNYLT